MAENLDKRVVEDYAKDRPTVRSGRGAEMENSRQRILETARALFFKKGYTASSMREIAEMAGIGKATIYHHFKDKEAIIIELMNSITQSMDGNLKGLMEISDPVERLKQAATLSLNMLIHSAELFSIVRRELPSGRQDISIRMTRYFGDFSLMIQDALKKGMASGRFRHTSAEDSASIFISMLQGFFASAYITGRKPESVDKAVDNLLDIYVNGIKAVD